MDDEHSGITSVPGATHLEWCLSSALLETLSKYSHDNDLQVAMGLVGAGTNNASSFLAQIPRQLAGFYQKEPDSLFGIDENT